MKTNLSILLLSLLLAGMMTFGLASCEDDEMEPMPDSEESILPPTEDEVKTTVGKSYAVLGGNFDEVTPYVLKRMTGQRYDYAPSDTYIADDVEVVFLDNESLMKLHETMAYEIQEVFNRGGSVYLHKPNALATAFFQMLMDDELDDFMDWMEENTGSGGGETRTDLDGDPLTRDSYLMSRNRNLDVGDIYNGKPVTTQVIVTDSLPDGTVQTRTEEQTFTPGEPTDYEYGRFAERIAAWINEGGEPATRTVPQYSRQLNQVEFTRLVPCRLQRDGDGKVITTQAEVKAWVSCLYNFNAQQDYYHVVLQQTYPGKDLYFGEYYKEGNTWQVSGYTLSCGYTYGGCTIHPVLRTDGFPIVTSWNPQPTAEGVGHTEYEAIDSWNANTYVASHDGTFGLHRNAYTHRMMVEKMSDEISIGVKRDDNKAYTWEMDLGTHLYYKYIEGGYYDYERYDLFGVPDESSLTRNTCITRQSWNWTVANTTARKDAPFTLDVHTTFRVKGAYRNRKEKKTAHQTTKAVYDGILSFDLPVPHRYYEVYKITCDEEIEAGEWAAIEKVMETRAPSYKLVTGNVTHYTKQKLDEEIGKRWNAFKSEMQGKLIDITGNYTLRLRDREGEEIGTPLYLGPTGGTTYEIGSYYLRDGSFLPPNTKPGALDFTKIVGVVCRLADDWSKPGLRGYVVSASDVDFNLHPWGDTFYQPEGSEGDSIPIDTYLSQEWGEHNTIEIFNAARIGGKEPSDKWYPLLKQLEYFRKRHATPEGSRDWFIPTATELADAIDAISDRTMQRAGGRAFRKDGSVYASSSTSPSEKDLVYGSFWNEKGFWQHAVKTDSQKKQFLLRPFLAF